MAPWKRWTKEDQGGSKGWWVGGGLRKSRRVLRKGEGGRGAAAGVGPGGVGRAGGGDRVSQSVSTLNFIRTVMNSFGFKHAHKVWETKHDRLPSVT